jgi:hypothetical protein
LFLRSGAEREHRQQRVRSRIGNTGEFEPVVWPAALPLAPAVLRSISAEPSLAPARKE